MGAESIYLIDRFVNTRVGEPYRLFPFGLIHKNGKTINLTPEYAATVKLPHFKPPIKLGSHRDETPAGGHMLGLEVRADGLYVIPEWNDNGTAAVNQGSFRYHSPEIITEGYLLNSLTGEKIYPPIIMGDALLHNPALGEAAAFYHVEKYGGNNMSEMTQVPTPLFEQFNAWVKNILNREGEPAPQPEPQPEVSKFEAELQAERAKVAEYAAKVEKMEAAAAAAERIAKFSTALSESPAVADDHELHTILARLPQEDADKLVTKFKALSAQINEAALTGDVGVVGDGNPPSQDTIVKLATEYAAEHKVSFNAAVSRLAMERPELFEAVTK